MKLDRELVKCRAFGHALDEDVAPINIRPIHGFQQFARCLRGCGTHRIQSLAADDTTVIMTEYRYFNEDYRAYYTPMSRGEAKRWLLDHPVSRRGRGRRALAS